jgi:hypothetical protein
MDAQGTRSFRCDCSPSSIVFTTPHRVARNRVASFFSFTRRPRKREVQVAVPQERAVTDQRPGEYASYSPKKISLFGCVVCIRRKRRGYIVSWCYSRPLHHLFLPFARDFARPHQRQHRTRRGFERRRRQVRTSILNIALTNYISPQGWPNKRVYNPRIHGSRQSQREFHRLPRRQPSPS